MDRIGCNEGGALQEARDKPMHITWALARCLDRELPIARARVWLLVA